jgi:hypothetical protein
MRARERGDTLGTLVVLIALAVIGYFVYQQFLGKESEKPPSCKAELSSCLTLCRKTTSEAPEYRACQERCDQKAAACK